MAELAESAFLAGGLEKHSFDEIRRLYGPGFNMKLIVADDAFVVSSLVLSKRLPYMLRVMAAYLSAPGLRAEAQSRFDDEVDRVFEIFERGAAGTLRGPVPRLLHGEDPRFGVPPRAVMERRTLEELRAWISEPLRHSYLELTVVGGSEVEEIVALAASTFGSLPPRAEHKASYASGRRVSFPDRTELVTFTYETRSPKAFVLSFWPTTDRKNDDDTVRLTLLEKIFKDRLKAVARNELGESYAVRSGHHASEAFPGFGHLQVAVDTSAEKAMEMLGLIRRIAEDLRRDGVTADELTRVREPMLNHMENRRLSVMSWAELFLGGSQEKPERLLWAVENPRKIRAVTTEGIHAAARKYLARDPLPVVVLPRPPDRPEP